MTSYTTLVNVDAEAATKLCHFVSTKMSPEKGPEFFGVCKELIETLKTEELIHKILEQKSHFEKETDAEGIFETLFSLIYALGDNNESQKIIRDIITSLIDATDKPLLRLKALTSLFNLTFAGDSKFEVLNAIFKYARETNQSEQITHLYAKYDDWVAAWSLTVDQQRELLKNLTLALQQTGKADQALATMTKIFRTCTGDKYPADVEELICAALLSAIQSPISAFSDRVALLESLNTVALTQDPASSLASLLRIICDGSLADFADFKAKSSAILTKHNLDADVLEHNLRLLSLCSLAARSQDKVISFADVKAAIGCVDDDEAEVWVIEAISENLLVASIDQLSGTVTVSKFAHRSFGASDWKEVATQLAKLRKSVAESVEAINSSKVPMI